MLKTRKIIRVISILVAISLLIALTPMEAFAMQRQAAENEKQIMKEINDGYINVFDNESENIDIEYEILDKRTEASKTFRLSNGQYTTAIFEQPIHREIDGKLIDLDNTLKSTEGNIKNIDGVFDVTFQSELEYGSIYTISDENYSIEWGILRESLDYDNKKLGSDDFQKITDDKNDISNNLSINEKESTTFKKIQAQEKALEKFESVNKIEKTDILDSIEVKSNSNQLIYSDIVDGIDLNYQLVSNSIKENIILNKKSDINQFSFTMKLQSLSAALHKDGKEIILKNNSDQEEYYISAPCMFDSEGNYSDNLKFELLEQDDSSYIVKLTADEEWLKSDERVYPVTIDPTIQKRSNTTTDLTFGSVHSKNPSTNNMVGYGSIWVGHDNGDYLTTRSYLKFKNLPEITTSENVVSAQMYLFQRSYAYQTNGTTAPHSMDIILKKVTSDWEVTTLSSNPKRLTWNNQPTTLNSVYEYTTVNKDLNGEPYCFDVTKLAKEWYSGSENYGLMLQSTEENYQKYVTFYTPTNVYASAKPMFVITYTNNDGIEDYWTYEEFNLNRAGSISVNHFTGNMVWAHSDVSVSGTKIPLAISHVYNHNKREETDVISSSMRFGKGIQLNVIQRLQPQTIDGTNYMVLTDSDGTCHYFIKQGNTTVYKNEFNDSIQIKATTGDEYVLEDNSRTKLFFYNPISGNGFLKRIEDRKGSGNSGKGGTQTMVYSGNQLRWVVDGGGRSAELVYNTSGYLTRIIDPSGRSTSFYYTNNYLTEIQYPDSERTYIAYEDGCIKSVKGPDRQGYELSYSEYNPLGGDRINKIRVDPMRVVSVKELGANNSSRSSLAFSYSAGYTKITADSGQEKKVYFDNFGRTVSMLGSDLSASYASYNDEDKKNNSQEFSSTAQQTTVNLLKDGSAELTSASPWTAVIVGGTGATYNISKVTNEKYYGTRSFKTTMTSVTTSSSFIAYSQTLTLTPGTYTISGYVKTDGITANNNMGACLYVGSNTASYSNYINGTNDWQRIQKIFTVTSTRSVIIRLGVKGETGSAYFDGLQLERDSGASRYNLLDNGHFNFDADQSTAITYWTRSSNMQSTDLLTSSNDIPFEDDRGNALYVSGDITKEKYVSQEVKISGTQATRFVVGAWAKAESVPYTEGDTARDRKFAVTATVHHTDSTTEDFDLHFEAKTTDWQYMSGSFVTSKAFNKITYKLCYNYQPNFVYFDNVQLYREGFGDLNDYDDEGRLISSTDMVGNKVQYEYNNSSLKNCATKIIKPNDNYTEFTYNTYQDVIKERQYTVRRNPDGTPITQNGNLQYDLYVEYNYTYDIFGNLLTSNVASGDGSLEIETSNEYSDYEYLSKATDAMGYSVQRTVNTNTGQLTSVKAADNSEMFYSYNSSNDRLTSERKSAYNGYALTTQESRTDYQYSNGLISSMSHTAANSSNKVYYNFNYDNFNQVTSVSVGKNTSNTMTLSTNEYSDEGRLIETVYGNAQSATPIYDNQDRIVGMKYNSDIHMNADETKYTWSYGHNGAKTQLVDSVNNVTWDFLYDENNRTETVYSSNNEWYHYNYDDKGRLTGSVLSLLNQKRTTEYTYDNLERPKTVLFGNNETEMNYTYDALGRLTSKKLDIPTSNVHTLETQYYFHPNGTNSTDQVKTMYIMQNTGSYDQVVDVYMYLYDANGRITRRYNNYGSQPYSYYQYDELGQLIRVNDSQANKTVVYEYDFGGNIKKKTIYPYGIDGRLPGVEETINYTYGHTYWKDVLTSYNGKAITYDGIANPKTYDGWTFTWEQGRQLKSMNKTGTSMSFKYDVSGLRTQKTVNGVTTKFSLEGDRIIKQTTSGVDTWFYYSSTGELVAMEYQNQMYYYGKNNEGDIMGLYREDGVKVAQYSYDVWGRLVSVRDENYVDQTNNTSHIGNKNPFRYRGYYYDAESSLYYLQSRYYNPEWGRFINGDAFTSTQQGVLSQNMFAYCMNNPMNMSDDSGELPFPNYHNPAYWHMATEPEKTAAKETVKKNPSLNSTVNPKIRAFAEEKGVTGNRLQATKNILIDIEGQRMKLQELIDEFGLTNLSWQLAMLAERKYSYINGEEFLFSTSCMAYEIEWHIQKYQDSKINTGLLNADPLAIKSVKAYFDDHCKQINLKQEEAVVVEFKNFLKMEARQTSKFGYKDGIRACYRETDKDPWKGKRK